MATNQKYDKGSSLSLPVPADTASGAPVLVGALCGTTRCAEGEGGNAANYATVDLEGAYEFTVAGALTPGVAVYITSGGALTATSTSNTLWGYSLTTKGSGSGLATVRPARV
jgi:hypothetical protein